MELKKVLERIPDPRGRQGRDYRLWSILGLILVSMLCGRRGMKAAFLLGRSLTRMQKRQLGFMRGHTPCHATLTETLRILDAQAVADILGAVVLADNSDDRHIAIDGKTLRASKDGDGRAEHVLSAYGMARPFSPWWDSLPGVLAEKEGIMTNEIAILGIDLGKNSCSVVGLDTGGAVVKRRRMRRETLAMFTQKLPACVIAMEACCGAHHLARLFTAQGHEVRLMSPEYVRPYVKAQKNDDRDAEAT